MNTQWEVLSADEFLRRSRQELRRSAVDSATLVGATEIVDQVRTDGELAIRKYAEQFGERQPNEAIIFGAF